MLARFLDGARMEIEAVELRFGKSRSHEHGGDTMSAADVRDATSSRLKFFPDSAQSRDPIADEMRSVYRSEETFGSAKETFAVLFPTHTFAALEGGRDFRLIHIGGGYAVVTSAHVRRAF